MSEERPKRFSRSFRLLLDFVEKEKEGGQDRDAKH